MLDEAWSSTYCLVEASLFVVGAPNDVILFPWRDIGTFALRAVLSTTKLSYDGATPMLIGLFDWFRT